MGWSLNKKNRPKSVISEVLSLATTGVEGFLLRTSCASPPPRLHSLSPTSCRLFALRRAHSAVRLPKFLRFKHKKKQTDPLLAYQENYSLSHYGSRTRLFALRGRRTKPIFEAAMLLYSPRRIRTPTVRTRI